MIGRSYDTITQSRKVNTMNKTEFRKMQVKLYNEANSTKLTFKKLPAEEQTRIDELFAKYEQNVNAEPEKPATEPTAPQTEEPATEKPATEKPKEEKVKFDKKAGLTSLETELKARLDGAEFSVTATKCKILVKKSGKSVFKCFVQKSGIRVYTSKERAEAAGIEMEAKSESYQFMYTAICTLEQIETLYNAEVVEKTEEDKDGE